MLGGNQEKLMSQNQPEIQYAAFVSIDWADQKNGPRGKAIQGIRPKAQSAQYKWRYRLERPDAQVKGTASTEDCRESTLRREITKLNRSLPDHQLSRSAHRSIALRVPELFADDGRLFGA
jgi:hypothetical protein